MFNNHSSMDLLKLCRLKALEGIRKMADCEFLESCPFFKGTLLNMPAMASYFKSEYCQRNFTACARYMVRQALGKEQIPPDLYPDETNRAERLIATG